MGLSTVRFFERRNKWRRSIRTCQRRLSPQIWFSSRWSTWRTRFSETMATGDEWSPASGKRFSSGSKRKACWLRTLSRETLSLEAASPWMSSGRAMWAHLSLMASLTSTSCTRIASSSSQRTTRADPSTSSSALHVSLIHSWENLAQGDIDYTNLLTRSPSSNYFLSCS